MFCFFGADRGHDMLRQLFGMPAKRIGKWWGSINQHAAAVASHATAGGQQIK
jgi:hypothetical protein